MARHEMPEWHTYGRHSVEARSWSHDLGWAERPRTVKELLQAHAPRLLSRIEKPVETAHRVVTAIYDQMVAAGWLGIGATA